MLSCSPSSSHIAAKRSTTLATPARAQTVLVTEGSSMSYLANSSDPGLGISWTAEAFTPAGWSAGVAFRNR